jgi:hypothetical protein
MKYLGLVILLVLAQFAVAQNYDYRAAFNPNFYTSTGNTYRSASGEPGHQYWQNRADYAIDVTFNPDKKTIAGQVTITYTNNSPNELRFLWVQLDQNLFKKTSRGKATVPVGTRFNKENATDGYVISSVGVNQYNVSKLDNYSVTDTRMYIGLKTPLASNGGTCNVTINYSFTIPQEGSDRMGYLPDAKGDVFAIAQWFPRMCVYDDVLGWNTLPYLGAGEFYLDYGNIAYNITAPGNQVILGSGSLLNEAECYTATQLARFGKAKNSDETIAIISAAEAGQITSRPKAKEITWRYFCENTRDVAWASSKGFIVDAARIKLPSGKPCLAISGYPEVASKTKDSWVRSTQFVKGSIEYYSQYLYEFSYPTAINIGCNIAGMEYPGIVFCSANDVGSALFDVTDHEFGHNWFPMIVGSNERKYAWMDEGFNTFINKLSADNFNKGEYGNKESFNASAANGQMLTLNDGLMNIPDVVQTFNLGVTAYFKPAAMLHTLRDAVLGPETFDRAFKEYVRRWAFKHPTPTDFFRTMENVSGEDLSWFWRGFVYNNFNIDLAIDNVNTDEANKTEVKVKCLGRMPMPLILGVTFEDGSTQTLKFPVEIWQRSDSYKTEITSPKKVKSITIDPDKILPEDNRVNNTWEAK